MGTGELLGSGRSADVYAVDDEWVLRRARDGMDVTDEAVVMAHLWEHGYPVPQVRLPEDTGAGAGARTDLVMRRLSGPTMVQSLLQGTTTPREGGLTLARLLHRLHAVPPLTGAGQDDRILHLDLHPDNVILTPSGPMVIDWTNTEEGPPGLDWAMSALILAQVMVAGELPPEPIRVGLAELLAHGDVTPGHLADVRARRLANPTMTERELSQVDEAVAQVLALRSEKDR